MKKSSNMVVSGFLAVLASSGVAFADDGSFQFVPQTPSQRAVIQDLINDGAITALNQENWYQINDRRLQELRTKDASGDSSAKWILNMLKSALGTSVAVSHVDATEAKLGSQDGGF